MCILHCNKQRPPILNAVQCTVYVHFLYMVFVMKSNSRKHIKKIPIAVQMQIGNVLRTKPVCSFFLLRTVLELMYFVLSVVLIHVFKPASCPFLTTIFAKRTRGLREGACNIKEHATETNPTLQDIDLQEFRLSFLGKISFKHLMNIYLLLQTKNRLYVSSVDMYILRRQISCKIIILSLSLL